MTLAQLEQYIQLRREEKLWAKELEDLRAKNRVWVRDTVRGSSAVFPYTEHPISISGIVETPDPRVAAMEERLHARRERCRREREEIEQYIDAVEDSQLRQILHYRFIKGYSWAKVSILMNNKESTLKMRLRRSFQKM